jgi:hypothetical protein
MIESYLKFNYLKEKSLTLFDFSFRLIYSYNALNGI